MSFPGILALAVVLVVLGAGLGMILFVRFLTSETDDDLAARFDPFAPLPLSRWFLDFFVQWRHRPKQLTYRRDAQGRFRKQRR